MVLDAVVWTVQQSFTPVGGSGAQERVHHLEKEQTLCQFLKFEQKPQNRKYFEFQTADNLLIFR